MVRSISNAKALPVDQAYVVGISPSRYRMLGGLSVLLTPTTIVVVAPGRVAEGVAPTMRVLACMYRFFAPSPVQITFT